MNLLPSRRNKKSESDTLTTLRAARAELKNAEIEVSAKHAAKDRAHARRQDAMGETKRLRDAIAAKKAAAIVAEQASPDVSQERAKLEDAETDARAYADAAPAFDEAIEAARSRLEAAQAAFGEATVEHTGKLQADALAEIRNRVALLAEAFVPLIAAHGVRLELIGERHALTMDQRDRIERGELPVFDGRALAIKALGGLPAEIGLRRDENERPLANAAELTRKLMQEINQ